MVDDELPALVSAVWLHEHLADPDLIPVDVRVLVGAGGPRGARDAYRSGHVPGAVFADLPHELCAADQEIWFAMPTVDAFATAIGRLGVGDDTRVVLYDGRQSTPAGPMTSLWAARLWWMLRWVGFDRAALLDGGIDAWRESGLPVREGEERRPPRRLTPRPRPDLIADVDDVRDALRRGDAVLVDTLDADHYAGRRWMYARPGHIPGAVNRPAGDLYDGTGRFLPVGDLAAAFEGLAPGRLITYCGGGIAACASAFAMTLAGRDQIAVYAASLQEWAVDPGNPLVLGFDGVGGAAAPPTPAAPGANRSG